MSLYMVSVVHKAQHQCTWQEKWASCVCSSSWQHTACRSAYLDMWLWPSSIEGSYAGREAISHGPCYCYLCSGEVQQQGPVYHHSLATNPLCKHESWRWDTAHHPAYRGAGSAGPGARDYPSETLPACNMVAPCIIDTWERQARPSFKPLWALPSTIWSHTQVFVKTQSGTSYVTIKLQVYGYTLLWQQLCQDYLFDPQETPIKHDHATKSFMAE